MISNVCTYLKEQNGRYLEEFVNFIGCNQVLIHNHSYKIKIPWESFRWLVDIWGYLGCLLILWSSPTRGSLRRLLDRQRLLSCRGPDLPRRRRTLARHWPNGQTWNGSVLDLGPTWSYILCRSLQSVQIEFMRGYSTQCPLKCLHIYIYIHHILQDCTLVSLVDITKNWTASIGANWTDPLNFILPWRHCKTSNCPLTPAQLQQTYM